MASYSYGIFQNVWFMFLRDGPAEMLFTICFTKKRKQSHSRENITYYTGNFTIDVVDAIRNIGDHILAVIPSRDGTAHLYIVASIPWLMAPLTFHS